MNPKIIISYLIGILVLVGILVFIGSRQATTSAYSVNDPNRPIAEVAKDHEDFGQMTNKDIKRVIFPVKNIGKSDLKLSNVSTSCDCTYAYITISNKRSEKFTMHGSNKDWIGEIKPGETAQIEVVYEPAIMPVSGAVERNISIVTNDPERQELAFHINAMVQD